LIKSFIDSLDKEFAVFKRYTALVFFVFCGFLSSLQADTCCDDTKQYEISSLSNTSSTDGNGSIDDFENEWMSLAEEGSLNLDDIEKFEAKHGKAELPWRVYLSFAKIKAAELANTAYDHVIEYKKAYIAGASIASVAILAALACKYS
jgi:hypothetical protein